MKRFDVAAGILFDSAGRILITERLGGGPFNGMWEFPGGKIGANENAEQALARELREELGISTDTVEYFMHLDHEYPDRFVSIDFFLVRRWQNEPAGLEGQQLRWVTVGELGTQTLLPADVPVVEALQGLN